MRTTAVLISGGDCGGPGGKGQQKLQIQSGRMGRWSVIPGGMGILPMSAIVPIHGRDARATFERPRNPPTKGKRPLQSWRGGAGGSPARRRFRMWVSVWPRIFTVKVTANSSKLLVIFDSMGSIEPCSPGATVRTSGRGAKLPSVEFTSAIVKVTGWAPGLMKVKVRARRVGST